MILLWILLIWKFWKYDGFANLENVVWIDNFKTDWIENVDDYDSFDNSKPLIALNFENDHDTYDLFCNW